MIIFERGVSIPQSKNWLLTNHNKVISRWRFTAKAALLHNIITREGYFVGRRKLIHINLDINILTYDND